MLKLMIFLIGFGFSLIGFIYIISYLNYLTIGYTIGEYLKLVITKPECLLAFLGLFLLSIVIFRKRNDNDLCI